MPGFAALNPRPRRGFTLIELLVAISILLILATMTFTMVNVTTKGDRIRTGARQVQSYLEGARDRAIHANEPRGVRFLSHPTIANTIGSMVYIGAPGKYREGSFVIATDRRTITVVSGLNWEEMYERGLISNGSPIEIAGNYYTIVRHESPPSSGTFVWQLTKDFPGAIPGPWTIQGATGGFTLQLNPSVLPNQEPRLLPSGVVIDLNANRSRIPSFWSGNNRDVLFSPRGTVTGLLASAGNVHLLLAEVQDVENGRDAVNANGQQQTTNQGDHLVLTITTQTGKVSTHPVYYLTDQESADWDTSVVPKHDKFRYAEVGGEAK